MEERGIHHHHHHHYQEKLLGVPHPVCFPAFRATLGNIILHTAVVFAAGAGVGSGSRIWASEGWWWWWWCGCSGGVVVDVRERGDTAPVITTWHCIYKQ